jgi:anti-sigma-K factor RskA
MARSKEPQIDAAEYVIGTMTAVERRAFEASMESNEDARADVAYWERAFGSLNASISPVAAPKDVWSRIEAALPTAASSVVLPGSAAANAAANDNQLDALKRSRGRWRMGAIAATVAAFGLGAFLMNSGVIQGQTGDQFAAGVDPSKQYIAVVNANGDQPSLVINIDAKTGEVSVRSVGVDRPEGKSLELWYVPEGEKAISVGLVGEGGIDLKDITAQNGDLLAISLEPQGGSPTGTATGPVIYTGKLIENFDIRPASSNE